MAVDRISAFLFANLITSVAYGIAFSLFFNSISIIVRKRRSTGQLNLPLVIPSILIFVFATVNVTGLWMNMYMALAVHGKNPELYLQLIRTPAKLVMQIGQVGAIVLADALVVYRAFIIWNHNYWIILLPTLTFAATSISGVTFVTIQHHIDIKTSIFSPTVTQWTVTFLLSSFATTVYSMGIIAFKVLTVQAQLRKKGIFSGGGVGRRILWTLVDSAALYSLVHLLYAVLYEMKNQVEMAPSYLEASIASITCSLIIVGSEAAAQQAQTIMSASSDPTASSGQRSADGKYASHQDGKVFALRSMEINVDVSDSRA